MRVLWFTNIPLDAVNRRAGRKTSGTGYWMHSLIAPLRQSGGVELAVATATPGYPPMRFNEDGVEYVNIPQSRVLETYDLMPTFRTGRQLAQAAALVAEWKPDLLHVHGTERFFGLVRSRGLTRVPTLVSVQGLVGEHVRWMYGSMTWRDAILNTTAWDLTRRATLPAQVRRRRRQGADEREILRGVDAVTGRTAWDRAHVRALNPGLAYYHVDEMLRPVFLSTGPWDLNTAARGTIITTSSPAPQKGLAVLLEAVAALRRWGHDVRLKVAGLSRGDRQGPAKFAFKVIDRLGLAQVVEPLGWADGEALARTMVDCHVFASPSFIENSSNAVCEAQAVGLPCVAAYSGGTPTIVRDGQSGLLFSPGDAAMLAAQIERVLLDDQLAARLGAAAREQAARRHDPAKIVADLIDCYRAVAAGAATATAERPTAAHAS